MKHLSILLHKQFRVSHHHPHRPNYVIGVSLMVLSISVIVPMFLLTLAKNSFNFIMIILQLDTQVASKLLNCFNVIIGGHPCPLMSAIMLMAVHYVNK